MGLPIAWHQALCGSAYTPPSVHQLNSSQVFITLQRSRFSLSLSPFYFASSLFFPSHVSLSLLFFLTGRQRRRLTLVFLSAGRMRGRVLGRHWPPPPLTAAALLHVDARPRRSCSWSCSGAANPCPTEPSIFLLFVIPNSYISSNRFVWTNGEMWLRRKRRRRRNGGPPRGAGEGRTNNTSVTFNSQEVLMIYFLISPLMPGSCTGKY